MARVAAFFLAILSALPIGGCRDRQRTPGVARTANTTPRTVAQHPAVAHDSLPPTDTTRSPRDIVRRYYDAIQRRDYDAAYALWGDGGKASGQSRQTFSAGFAQTAQVRVQPADSVSIEGAAGSQYATVPVAVDAVLRNGQKQHFQGTYTLRRSMVDGATAEQRQWRIYSAKLRPG